MSERLLSAQDVAKILNVNRHKISEYVAQGLAVVRLPGSKRRKFTIEDVRAFIERCKSGPDGGPTEEATSRETAPKRARMRRSRQAPKKQGRMRSSPRPHGWRSDYHA